MQNILAKRQELYPYFEKIKTTNKEEECSTGFNILTKLFENIKNNKSELQYRLIKTTNKVISSKLREEKNISKRLQDSIMLSQNKEKNEELIIQLNTYKEKYERLANSISDIESRLKSASQSNIKYQENELNYKKNIKFLEEKLKKHSENFQKMKHRCYD